MARINGMAFTNGFEPPPSSMLATHVRPGASIPHLNQQHFTQLLEESLGQDENGRSNLSDDPELNQKLIMVVVHVGINPLLAVEKENPFQSKNTSGRGALQLRQSLDVLHLAVARTRFLLYRECVVHESNSTPIPLYSDLLPKLFSITARYQNLDITKQVFNIVEAGLQHDKLDESSNRSALKGFVYASFIGLSSTIVENQYNSLSDPLSLRDDKKFLLAFSTTPVPSADIGSRFNITTMGQGLFLACQLATFLFQHETTKFNVLRMKKQTAKLQIMIDDFEKSSHDAPQIEALRAEVGGLTIAPPAYIESFTTIGDFDEWPDSGRARKRLRLSTSQDLENDTSSSVVEQILRDFTRHLTGYEMTDLVGLQNTVVEQFKSISEEEQCIHLQRIGYTACQLYTLSPAEDISCPICDGEPANIILLEDIDQYATELLHTLMVLRPLAQRRSKTRLLALQTLRRLLSHIHTTEHLKLKGSNAGDWWLQAMRSPSRELKVAASLTLSAFIRSDSKRDSTLVHENCVATLEILQALWQEDHASTQEAVVLALAQMSRVVGDEALNIILLRLIDYLGHPNTHISALVYSEIQCLAEHLQINNFGLLRPFWRTLSVVIVQNLTKRPAIAQRVADLMGTQVDGLMQMMEEYVLPYLVLKRDLNTINRMCAASSTHTTPFDLCIKQSNFPNILALLLIQNFEDPEQSIMELLLHVSDDFGEQDFVGWAQLYSNQLTCELLKSIGDAGPAKASKTYQGLQYLAQLLSRRTKSSAAARRKDATVSYLEDNALAIVTYFTVKLNDVSFREPNVEKRRYLTALGEVVKLGKGRLSVALPHICACLRAAIHDDLLCNTAFNTWCDIAVNIDEDDIRELINQTFAIVVRSWSKLDSSMQDRAYELIATLFRDYEAIIRDSYSTLPSLASIPIMIKFESDINKLKKQRDERNQLAAFVPRLKDENMIVVEQALSELSALLKTKQEFCQKLIMREQPDTLIADLVRATLDACITFQSSCELLLYGGQCLGALGCLDPSKIESIREKKRFVVLSNFIQGHETIGFLMFFMEQILVKEYVSTSNLREKGFLAWALQQLLQFCNLPKDITSRTRVGGLSGIDRQWFDLSDTTRLVLTPFLTSKFTSQGKRPNAEIRYPFFKPGMAYKTWLTGVTLDFLNRCSGDNVDMIFDICSRLVVHGQRTSIASFLLPYAALNLLLAGTETDKRDLMSEISCVLQQTLADFDLEPQEQIRQCSQSIFDILDYISLFLQELRADSNSIKAGPNKVIKNRVLDIVAVQTQSIDSVIAMIPPQIITQKAVECRSFARALFHQEQYVRSKDNPTDADFKRLQDIYEQIDEPDGIEGFSAQMKFLDVESEVMEHKKAGRWNAAQSWYEMQLIKNPQDADVQINLLRCLKESGQHDVLLHHFDGITSKSERALLNLLPFAIEAAWVTDRWDKLATYLAEAPRGNFAVGLGAIMLALKQNDIPRTKMLLDQMFQSGTSELTPNSTISFQASHESLLKLHILDDIRIMLEATDTDSDLSFLTLKHRLDILGSNVADKQYVLGIHRAIMQLRPDTYDKENTATLWMTSARLARKAQSTQQAFNSLLRASVLGDASTAIEQAKLMWQEGDHRKAIQTLEGAIDSGVFGTNAHPPDADSMTVDGAVQEERNDMAAKAYVLLGKWLDQAGQTQSEMIIKTFRKSTEQNRRWEKGWYNLGRHYNKILESEKSKQPGKESQPFLSGEAAKLVIDNFLRALVSGNKYMFQTLPKVLTLWLDLVDTEIEQDARRGNSQFHQHNKTQRKKMVDDTNATMKKYLDRIQPYALYTILPQLVARICHTDQTVNNLLQLMIVKVIKAFPQQALWTVLATVKSASKDRGTRGLKLLRSSAENTKKDLKVFTPSEMREFITASQKFSDELLRVADFHVEGRLSKVSLARDLGFNHKIAPSKLVVPSEACLIPNIPSNNEAPLNKNFRAFAKEPITITAFLDEARVLPSLQKPRKLSLRGSDGKIYSVLAKPHDDLRKDQRLMEFNTMINRFLKHDIEATKRRLYIRTYAVIPLNEECGLIEWVDGLTTMRDILLKLYSNRGVKPDYPAVREALDKICAQSKDMAKDFIEQVQSRFPPVLQQWFIENFPDPTAWFNARLRYTRTSAVMSMVGHVLGLGDRHGENILFEEGTGGILHVDFNCLFDKGLTFEKPECVPFRLTHNMRHAMGTYEYDGPFRRCCEITTNLLRNNEDALMTILETFLHDPTTDFQTSGKKRKQAVGYAAGVEVPDTPERMLEGVKGKVRGMLPGESVPLSVGGYVYYMIRQAKDEANLARMYIGWCAFF